MSKIYIRSKQLRGVTTVKIDGQCYYPSTTKIGLNEQPLTDISQAEAFYVGDCDTCEEGSVLVGVNQLVTVPLSGIKSGKQFTMSTPPLTGTRVITIDNPPGPPIEIQLEINDDDPGRFKPGNLVLDPVPLGSGPTVYTPPPQDLPQTKIYTKLPNNDIEVTLVSTDPFVVTVKESVFVTVDPLPAPTHQPPQPPGDPVDVKPGFLSAVDTGKTNTDDFPVTFSIPSEQFPGPTAVIIPPTGEPIRVVHGPGDFTACPGCTIYTGPPGNQPGTETPPTGVPGTVTTTSTPPSSVEVTPLILQDPITSIIVNTTNPPKTMQVELCDGQDGVVVHTDGSTTKYAKPRPADPSNPVMVTLNPGDKLACGTLTDIEELPPVQIPPGTVTVGTPPSAVQVAPPLDPVIPPPVKNGGGTPIEVPFGPDGVVVCEDGTRTMHKGPGVLTLEPGCILIQGKIDGVTETPPPDDGTITVGSPPTTIVVGPGYLDPIADPPATIIKNETDPPETIMVELNPGPDGVVVCEDGTITGHRGPGSVPVPPGCQLIQGVCTSLCDTSVSTSLWDAVDSTWNEFNSTWN